VIASLGAALSLTVFAATEHRFVLFLGEAPLSELRLRVDERQLTYEAIQFLGRGPARWTRTFDLDPAGKYLGRPLETTELLSRPNPGCRVVLEERRSREERLCVDEVGNQSARGRIGDVEFVARYDARNRLVELAVGGARWTRTESSPYMGAELPFAAGIAVEGEGSTIDVSPPITAVQQPLVEASGTAPAPDETCLELANRAIERDRQLTLVLGLVVEEKRAVPHAWTRRGAKHLDPSVLVDDESMAGRQYLALPPLRVGRTYLELFSGRRTVRRR
jgi:hypothetical protein